MKPGRFLYDFLLQSTNKVQQFKVSTIFHHHVFSYALYRIFIKILYEYFVIKTFKFDVLLIFIISNFYQLLLNLKISFRNFRSVIFY